MPFYQAYRISAPLVSPSPLFTAYAPLRILAFYHAYSYLSPYQIYRFTMLLFSRHYRIYRYIAFTIF